MNGFWNYHKNFLFNFIENLDFEIVIQPDNKPIFKKVFSVGELYGIKLVEMGLISILENRNKILDYISFSIYKEKPNCFKECIFAASDEPSENFKEFDEIKNDFASQDEKIVVEILCYDQIDTPCLTDIKTIQNILYELIVSKLNTYTPECKLMIHNNKLVLFKSGFEFLDYLKKLVPDGYGNDIYNNMAENIYRDYVCQAIDTLNNIKLRTI